MEQLDTTTVMPRTERVADEQATILYEARVTRDPALINQYRLLRHDLYTIDERFVGFRVFNSIGAEDYDDPDHHMILLTNGNRCYGGMCVRISTPSNPVILDLENDILPDPGKYYFSLRERLPEMHLSQYAYAEFSRMTLHPAVRSKEATRRILKAALDFCYRNRVRYLFLIGDAARVRFYKQTYAGFGLRAFLANHITIPMRPEYEGVQMHLLCGDLKALYVTDSDPEASVLEHPRKVVDFY